MEEMKVKTKMHIVLERQLERIERLAKNNPQLKDALPHVVISSPKEEEVFAFAHAYADKMNDCNLYSYRAFCEALEYPYQPFETGRYFFDSIVYAALNRHMPEYVGVLLLNISEWIDHMNEKDFLEWLCELKKYTASMRIVFYVGGYSENMDRISNQIKQVLPIVTHNITYTHEEMRNYVDDVLREKKIAYEEEKDRDVVDELLQMEQCESFEQLDSFVERMISYTFKVKNRKSYIGSKDLIIYKEQLLNEQRMGMFNRLGF